jgi:polysaccharide deacetylase family protein (PEP-CTERM system associated)
MVNAITVDVEEYFHATEVRNALGQAGWTSLPSRIQHQVHNTLDLFQNRNVKATFFILGWVAERFPALVRKVAEAGHEIACHSYAHNLVYDLSPAEFRADTLRAKQAIEDACGISPRIYRAPSYSITRQSLWALEILVECGFSHDSSIVPINHDRYGIPGTNRLPHMLNTPSGQIFEIPAATVELAHGKVLPIGGGGYLRLLPYRYCSAGIRRVNERDRAPACIYFHPWELDPELSRLPMGLIARLRTYSGVSGMQRKVERLLEEFEFSTISAAYPYRPAHSGPELAGAASILSEARSGDGD